MKLEHLFEQKKCPFALEVFPPKRTNAVETVYGTLERMRDAKADYISVTYSAGGTGAREYTAEIARFLHAKMGVTPLAHLTCMNAHRSEVEAELARMRGVGVENILALRGDRNPGAAPGDFAHASDLIALLAQSGDFYIAAACYPEGHPDSPDLRTDVQNLKRKLDAGAGHLVSQLFFDNSKFFSFVSRARAAGVHCPIEAGVMPIVKKEQIERTVALSSASLPSEFTRMVSRWADDPNSFYKAGVDYAIRQIRSLIEGGADGVHLYAMNRPEVALAVRSGIEDLL